VLLSTEMKSCTFCLAGFDIVHDALMSEYRHLVQTYHSMVLTLK